MKYIIHQPWGGLGDNLQYSTLPEQLSKQGHEVWLSKFNACRNQEIFDLAWKHNKFLRGISEEQPNCGWIGVDPQQPTYGINKWELLFGADPSEGLPKIYWEPPLLKGFENTVIVDLNFSSCTYFEDKVMAVLYREVAQRWPNRDIRQVAFTKKVSHHSYLSKFEQIEVSDIWHYCSLITSCRAVVTLLTGSSPLAAAIKKFNATPQILTIKKSDYHEGQIFPNVEFVDAH